MQVERVESEVVLNCDGYNTEHAFDMLCYDVKMKCSCVGHNASSGLQPREKNHVCGSVKCACLCERVECSVYGTSQHLRDSCYALTQTSRRSTDCS